MKIQSYEDLVVWQKSMDLVIEIYKLTNSFPKEEIYGLSSQMRRASISIPSNIAEGSRRGTRKDYRNFINNALGSGAELETQIKIAKRLCFVMENSYTKCDQLLNEIMRMMKRMALRLQPTN